MTFLYLTTDLKTLFCCDHLSCLRLALRYFPKKKTRQEMEVLFNLDGICGFPCSKKARKEEEMKRGGCFLFRSSSETGQKFICITINQNISSYNSQNINIHSELQFFWMLLMAGISSAHHCSSFRISSPRRWPGVLNVCGRMWGLFSLCDNFRKSSAATIEHHMYIVKHYM